MHGYITVKVNRNQQHKYPNTTKCLRGETHTIRSRKLSRAYSTKPIHLQE